jgi:hypothetical protein
MKLLGLRAAEPMIEGHSVITRGDFDIVKFEVIEIHYSADPSSLSWSLAIFEGAGGSDVDPESAL